MRLLVPRNTYTTLSLCYLPTGRETVQNSIELTFRRSEDDSALNWTSLVMVAVQQTSVIRWYSSSSPSERRNKYNLFVYGQDNVRSHEVPVDNDIWGYGHYFLLLNLRSHVG